MSSIIYFLFWLQQHNGSWYSGSRECPFPAHSAEFGAQLTTRSLLCKNKRWEVVWRLWDPIIFPVRQGRPMKGKRQFNMHTLRSKGIRVAIKSDWLSPTWEALSKMSWTPTMRIISSLKQTVTMERCWKSSATDMKRMDKRMWLQKSAKLPGEGETEQRWEKVQC